MIVILQDCVFSSKTQKKKYLDLIYRIVEVLANSSDKILKSLDLPAEIYIEIQLLKKISSGGARKRQQQQIAKMVREYDFEYDNVLELIKILPDKNEKIILLAQIWASKLVEQEISAEEFLKSYNMKDTVTFNQLLQDSVNSDEDYDCLVKFLKKIVNQYVFF